jgi:hypothetical protein
MHVLHIRHRFAAKLGLTGVAAGGGVVAGRGVVVVVLTAVVVVARGVVVVTWEIYSVNCS